MIEKFAPVDIKAEITDKQKPIIRKLIQAAKILDSIFLEQVYSKNKELKEQLEGEQLELFNLHYGPFDRINHNKSFIEGHTKPKGANFYPEDMTKEEFKEHIKNNPQDKDLFESTHSIIRRVNDKLVAIQYSEAYKEQLDQASQLLKEAASLTNNTSLKNYLDKRADAFLTNDYFDSDIAWMDLNSSIEPTIGPYEVYEDELFGYKAAFEAFIAVKDEGESEKLAEVRKHLDELEHNLPIDDEYKNHKRGKDSPIAVVNEVYCGGDGRAGVQFTAFNLPNDERVREAKGSKKVMVKNIAHAKYDKCWVPIVKEVMDESIQSKVSFDAYFTHILLHEISHGLGPGNIVVDGKETTVSLALKETYPTIEEAKADVLGIYNMFYLVDQGFYPKSFEEEMVCSFIGGIFRSVRFGIAEAHGGGNVIIFNHLLDRGVITYNGKFSVTSGKARTAFTELAQTLLMIQAKGDYEAAKKLIEGRVIRQSMQEALERLDHIPVDIRPIFEDI